MYVDVVQSMQCKQQALISCDWNVPKTMMQPRVVAVLNKDVNQHHEKEEHELETVTAG